MRRIGKYTLRALLTVILLFLLIPVLFYIPAIQRYVKDKAVEYVTAHYDLKVSIGKLAIKFPFDLVVEEAFAGKSLTDTMIYVEHLRLNVGIRKLLQKEFSVDELVLNRVKARFMNDSTGLMFKSDLEELKLEARRIDLKRSRAEIELLQLAGGTVFLTIGEKTGNNTVEENNPFTWAFLAKKMEFERVRFHMESASLPLLTAEMKSGKIVNGAVDIGRQSVETDSVRMDGGDCRIRLGKSVDTGKNENDTASLWTVRVGNVHMADNAFQLTNGDEKQIDINLTGIDIRIDSVYNRGTVVRANLKQLRAIRKEGGRIESMSAAVNLDTAKVHVAGVYIKTAHTLLKLDARSDASMTEAGREIPLSVKLDAVVGMQDVALFYDKIPQEISKQSLQLKTEFRGDLNEINVKQLIASMPGCFRVTANGHVASIRKLSAVSGNLKLEGELSDVSFVNAMLGGRVVLPRGLRLSAQIDAVRGKVTPVLGIALDSSSFRASGDYVISSGAYDAHLILKDFRLDKFLPGDSLGAVTADFRLAGRGMKWGKAEAKVVADIASFVYKRHPYEKILLNADLKGSLLEGALKSEDPDFQMNIAFKADSVNGQYNASLKGEVQRVDLRNLNFTNDDFIASLNFEINASSGDRSTYLLHGDLNEIQIDNGNGAHHLGGLVLHMDSDLKKTDIDLVAGDFQLAFQGDTTILRLPQLFSNAIKVARQQVKDGTFNMLQVQHLLPVFTLKVEGAEENLIGKYLKDKGVGFKKLRMDIASPANGRFSISSDLKFPYFKNMEFDSVRFELLQAQEKLDYTLDLSNSSDNFKDLFHINASGFVRQDQVRVAVKQQNREGITGFDLGLDFTFRDSVVSMSFFPMTPILGYSRWIINADNRITLYDKKKIDAHLRLAYEDKLIRIQSLPDQGDAKDRLQLEIQGIDMVSVSNAIPFIPDMSGMLHTDVLLYSQQDHLVADGNVGITDFYYMQQRIGTVDMALSYQLGSQFTRHAVDFALHLDGKKRAVVKGKFSTEKDNKELFVDMDIPSFPLSVVSAFVPESILKLEGELTGKIDFRGTLDQPQIDGGVVFKNSSIEVTPLGTVFGMDSSRIGIKNSRVLFDNYKLMAPNKQPLGIKGELSLVSLKEIRTDLVLTAKNFQAISVKQNPTSMVYGKAYVDLNARIDGPVSALNLTGNVNLLNNTEVDYVIRSSAPELKDRSLDLVRFVSFRDTTLSEKDALANRVKMNNFTMKLFVEIGNAVSMNINLSENGENKVSIKGGGNLTYSMNQEGGNSLIGKYTLTGGMVRYNIPVVGQKLFNIQSGSFVEWTGDMLNPTFSIAANESLKVSVIEDNQASRLVTFDAIIRIQNTLQSPEITFDLSAPSDQTIQNQLATYSPEERSKQAMNLLIYNSYTGPGAGGGMGNTANNTLNSFIEKELNQWTRKSGLTFGINTYDQTGTDGQVMKRTDYSYQYSKQLFNDKVNVKIGGRVSADDDPTSSMEDNLVDDISIEYVFDKNRNLFLKVFRHTNYESVLEGEVTQTGVGVVLRKSFRKFKDLFISKKKRE